MRGAVLRQEVAYMCLRNVRVVDFGCRMIVGMMDCFLIELCVFSVFTRERARIL